MQYPVLYQFALDFQNAIACFLNVRFATGYYDHVGVRAFWGQIDARRSFLADFTNSRAALADDVLVEFLKDGNLEKGSDQASLQPNANPSAVP